MLMSGHRNRIPSYMARIRQGVLDAAASPTLHRVTPAVAQVDGHNGFGFLAAHMGMAAAIDMAKEVGIGMVSVKHSNHFGMSAWVVQQALDAGMMSLVFTNSSPALPVWGGKSKLMGVSPIACGAPAGKGRPFIVDMAPSVAARARFTKHCEEGRKFLATGRLTRKVNEQRTQPRHLKVSCCPWVGPKARPLLS